MKPPSLILILVLLPWFLFAQAELDAGKQAKQTCLEVFNTIKQSQAQLKESSVELSSSSEKKYIAKVSAASRQAIIIEEEALKICMSFGDRAKDAMAVILGHEFYHLMFHQSPKAFAFGERLIQTGDRRKIELQADFGGLFLALQAGFRVLDIQPKLLETLHDGYPWLDQHSNYPLLEERKRIAQHAIKKARQIDGLFTVANTLAILEDFESSNLIYNHLKGDFPSPEVYNNSGYTALMQSLNFSNLHYRFIYPVELAYYSRSRGTSGIDPRSEAELKKWLDRARTDLQNAANMVEESPRLPLAFSININLATTYSLLGKPKRALGIIEQTEENVRPGSKEAGRLNMLKAIVYANLGNMKDAKKGLKSLIKKSEFPELTNIAKANLVILNDKEPKKEKLLSPIPSKLKESMGGIDRDYLYALPSDTVIVFREINVARSAKLHICDTSRYQLLTYRSPRPYGNYFNLYLIRQVEKDTLESARGLKKGISLFDWEVSYGPASSTRFSSNGGEWRLYKHSGLIVKVNAKQEIEDWIIWYR